MLPSTVVAACIQTHNQHNHPRHEGIERSSAQGKSFIWLIQHCISEINYKTLNII